MNLITDFGPLSVAFDSTLAPGTFRVIATGPSSLPVRASDYESCYRADIADLDLWIEKVGPGGLSFITMLERQCTSWVADEDGHQRRGRFLGPPGTVEAWCEEQGIEIERGPGALADTCFRIVPRDDAEAVFVMMRWA